MRNKLLKEASTQIYQLGMLSTITSVLKSMDKELKKHYSEQNEEILMGLIELRNKLERGRRKLIAKGIYLND